MLKNTGETENKLKMILRLSLLSQNVRLTLSHMIVS